MSDHQQPNITNQTNNTSPSIFDQEAKALWKKLGINKQELSSDDDDDDDETTKMIKYNHLDAIYKHPKTGATIFCGDRIASVSPGLLDANGITHLVNCTAGVGEIKNVFENDRGEFKDKYKYYRFPISNFCDFITEENESVDKFVDPLYSFIDSALENGKNVLVFCLAGAHRAGTTATSCLIYYEKMDPETAIRVAKSRRSVMDPIHKLPYFLMRVYDAKVFDRKDT